MVPDSASDNAHCCNPKIEDTPCQCASWVTVRASNLEGARSVHRVYAIDYGLQCIYHDIHPMQFNTPHGLQTA